MIPDCVLTGGIILSQGHFTWWKINILDYVNFWTVKQGLYICYFADTRTLNNDATIWSKDFGAAKIINFSIMLIISLLIVCLTRLHWFD